MIAPWASAYVGIPFLTGGRDHSGCDCWGCLYLIYREVFGINLPSYADEYDSVRDGDVIRDTVKRHLNLWSAVPLGDVLPGDGLLFRLLGQPVHIGVAVGDGRFLHVYNAIAASCIDRLAAPTWTRRVLGAYRYAH